MKKIFVLLLIAGTIGSAQLRPPASGGGGGTPASDTRIGATVSDIGSGTPIVGVWNNPTNAQSENGVSATNTLAVTEGDNTNFLQVTNFGFSIPTGSIINAIYDSVKVFGDYTPGEGAFVVDNFALQQGVPTGSCPDQQPISNTVLTWQRLNLCNLYGVVWTPADINASNSGFTVSFEIIDFPIGKTLSVDAFKRTVNYTTAGGGGTAAVRLGTIFYGLRIN